MSTRNGRADAKAREERSPIPGTGLGLLLREAYTAYGRNFQSALAELGVTYAQWRHLWLLLRDGGLTPVELSRRAGVKKASSTAVIDFLARRRLIKRTPDAHDRRRVNLSLTASGIALLEAAAVSSRIINLHARTGVSDTEYARMVATLRKLIANLDGLDPAALHEVVSRTTCPKLPRRRPAKPRPARIPAARP